MIPLINKDSLKLRLNSVAESGSESLRTIL